jgi:hypothetical protein
VVLSNATPDVRRRCAQLGVDAVFDKSGDIEGWWTIAANWRRISVIHCTNAAPTADETGAPQARAPAQGRPAAPGVPCPRA